MAGRPKVLKTIALVSCCLFALGSCSTESDGPPQTRPSMEGTDRPVSEVEAVRIFEQLHKQLRSAYRLRDRTLIADFAYPGGPTAARVDADIDNLLADGVLPRSSFETRRIELSSVEDREMKLVQIVVTKGRFLSESGREVTVNRKAELQTVEWILRSHDDRWLFYDSVITSARKID